MAKPSDHSYLLTTKLSHIRIQFEPLFKVSVTRLGIRNPHRKSLGINCKIFLDFG